MGKIEVDKEVFNALNEYLSEYDKALLLRDHCAYSKWENPKFRIFNKISLIDMAEILINGYELKETPEEKLLKTYQNQIEWQKTNNIYNRGVHAAFANSMVYTLDTLGVKIKGIND